MKLAAGRAFGMSVTMVVVVLLALGNFGCATAPATSTTVAAETSTTLSPVISNIVTMDGLDTINVLINGNGALTYTAVKQPLPPGVVLYFPDTTLEGVPADIPVGMGGIQSISAREIVGARPTARVEIRLGSDTPYEVAREGSSLRISFEKTMTQATAGDETAGEKMAPAPVSEMAPKPEPAMETETQAEAGSADMDADASLPPGTMLKGVDFSASDSGVTVHIESDGAIKQYDAFTVQNPARIVFDVHGIDSKFKGQQVVPVNTDMVQRVRHFKSPDRLRIVLDTQAQYLNAFKAVPVRDGLRIQVGSVTADAAPAAAMTAETVPAEAAAPEAAAAASEKRMATPDRMAWVNRIDFSSEENGKSTVIIGTTLPVDYRMQEVKDNTLLLSLMNTNLPGYRKRALITTRFESALDRVIPFQTQEMATSTGVTFELREDVPYHIEQVDDLLMVHFDASSVPPRPLDEANLPPWQTVLMPDQVMAAAEEASPTAQSAPAGEAAGMAPAAETAEMTAAPMAAATAAPAVPSGVLPAVAPSVSALAPKTYTGEKIAFDFYKTDITNVIRIFQEVSGKNFAVDNDVSGRVTLKFDKPVPWDQAMALVLKMNRLGMTYEGDIIRIATLATLEKEEQARRKKLDAKQEAVKQEDLVTAFIPISYTTAADIATHITPLITTSRADDGAGVTVDERLNTLIITDVPSVVKRAKEIVEKLDLVTPQVLIEARIVEATESFKREIGTTFSMGTGGTPIPSDALAGTVDYSIATSFPKSASSLFSFDYVKIGGTPLSLSAKLNALDETGEGKVISSPKIVTLDNKAALIKQGVSYPINKLDSDGNTTTEYKDIALELSVTPHVTPDGRVNMKITITKNDIGTLIGTNFTFTVNEANTELLVNDGDTVVIGGITKDTKTLGEAGVPGIKDVPLLGWLFKNTSKDEAKSELLIFLTPRIIRLEQRDMSTGGEAS